MELLKVEGERHLYKDPTTGAILNNDTAGYESYLAQRAVNEAKRQQVLTIEQEVDELKEDVKDIKRMLQLLLEKK